MRGADYLLSFCFCRDKDEKHLLLLVLVRCSVCCSVDMLCQVDNEMCEIFLGHKNIFFQIVFIFYLLLLVAASNDLDVLVSFDYSSPTRVPRVMYPRVSTSLYQAHVMPCSCHRVS